MVLIVVWGKGNGVLMLLICNYEIRIRGRLPGMKQVKERKLGII